MAADHRQPRQDAPLVNRMHPPDDFPVSERTPAGFRAPAGLGVLQAIAGALNDRVGQKYLADQIEMAVNLARAMTWCPGTQVLAVNPSLGKPWAIAVMRICGCAVTVLDENPKLLAKVEEELAILPGRHEDIPELARILAATRSQGEVEFRHGQVSLFFPEEDRFDAVCLFRVGRGLGGFGPEPLLLSSLRGLREGGLILTGFMDPVFSKPAIVRKTAAGGDFDLEGHQTSNIRYDEYAPAGLLFKLREKHGRSVGRDVFELVAAGLRAHSRGSLSGKIEEALQLARDLGTAKGTRTLVLNPTPDLWSERIMAGLAGQIHLVFDADTDLDEARSEFSFFPGIAAVNGGLKLQQALRNPNNQIYHTGFLRALSELKAYDVICLGKQDDLAESLRICLGGLKPKGRLLVGCDYPRQRDPGAIAAVGQECGVALAYQTDLKYGPLHAELFVRNR
jgi:SAM-dependent methyltransferase